MDIPIDKKKPLLIHGVTGSGETHMALKLAKDMVFKQRLIVAC